MRFFKRSVGKVSRAIFGRGANVSLTNAIILGKKYGQYKTANMWSCVNAEGQPIPWYTYPAIEYLENLRLSDLTVLEYGSGYSSRYFLRRDANVVSIENNRAWYDKIKTENENENEKGSFKYVLATSEEEYIKRDEIVSADIVVIDGSYRPACADFVIKNIAEGHSAPSVIIFDNSDWYPKAIRRIDVKVGWVRVDFCGFGPINAYTWVTSIYFNPSKVLPRINDHITSISGVMVNRED